MLDMPAVVSTLNNISMHAYIHSPEDNMRWPGELTREAERSLWTTYVVDQAEHSAVQEALLKERVLFALNWGFCPDKAKNDDPGSTREAWNVCTNLLDVLGQPPSQKVQTPYKLRPAQAQGVHGASCLAASPKPALSPSQPEP